MHHGAWTRFRMDRCALVPRPPAGRGDRVIRAKRLQGGVSQASAPPTRGPGSLEFDGDRRGLTATNAKRRHALGPAMGFKRMDQGDQQTRTGRANRMTQRTGTAMDIDLAVIKLKIADCGHRDDSKSLVHFP